MTITEFLTARLDEARQRAEAMEHFTVHEQPYYSCAGSRTEPYGDLEWGEEHCDCHLAERKARALREVEAKRSIMTFAAGLNSLNPGHGDFLFETLAVIDSDHPDYDESWKP